MVHGREASPVFAAMGEAQAAGGIEMASWRRRLSLIGKDEWQLAGCSHRERG